MPKHKMWLMRCQQESQEQDMPLHPVQPPAAQLPLAPPGQFTHVSVMTPHTLGIPAGFAQLEAPAAQTGLVRAAAAPRDLALQSLQGPLPSLPELAGQPSDRPCAARPLPHSTQQSLQPVADSQAALSAIREPCMLPVDSKLPAVRPTEASSRLLAASQVAEPRHESLQDDQAAVGAHMPVQPEHGQQKLAQPATAPAGLPVETSSSKLPPERVLQSWQALSAASAQCRPRKAAPPLSQNRTLGEAEPLRTARQASQQPQQGAQLDALLHLDVAVLTFALQAGKCRSALHCPSQIHASDSFKQ